MIIKIIQTTATMDMQQTGWIIICVLSYSELKYCKVRFLLELKSERKLDDSFSNSVLRLRNIRFLSRTQLKPFINFRNFININ